MQFKLFLGKFNETPLMKSARNGHFANVKSLIEIGEDVNAKDRFNETALMKVAWRGHLDVAKLLIEHGADVNVENDHKSTALIEAARNGHVKIAELLIENGGKVNAEDNSETALILTAKAGHTKLAQLLIENGAEVNARDDVNETALMKAVWNGHFEIAKLLIENGADVNVKDENRETPLIKAAWNGHLDIVKLLIENGADIDEMDNINCSALKKAALRGHLIVAKWFLENGSNMELALIQSCSSPIQSGHLEVVEFLIQNGVDVNTKDDDSTPLIQATRNGHFEITKLLLEHGANVNSMDKNHKTALVHATHKGYENIIHLLLQYGANSASLNRENEIVGVSSELLNIQSSTSSLGSNTLKSKSLEELRFEDCSSGSSTKSNSLKNSDSGSSETFTEKLSSNLSCTPAKYQPLSKTNAVIKNGHVTKVASNCQLPSIDTDEVNGNCTDSSFQTAEFSLSVYGPYFLTGAVLSLITLVIPSMLGIQMKPDLNDHHQMSDDVVALLVNLCLIGMPIGCCSIWFIGDKLGRKEILLISHILPWIILASCNSHFLLHWSFVTLGFGAIVLSIPIIVYVRKNTDETTNTHRTIFLSGTILSSITGFIIMFIMGMFFSWQQKTLFGFFVQIWIFFIMNQSF